MTRTSPRRASFIACLVVLLSMLSAAYAGAAPTIQPYLSTGIKTLRLSSTVAYEDRTQLDNIGGDFANLIQVQRGAKSISLTYMQPEMLRYDARVLGARITYIIDGDNHVIEVPLLHVHKTSNVAGAPGKQNTLLDCGVVPPEQLGDYDATYLRTESGLLCFQLLSKLKSDPFKDLVWIDPKTHVTVQRYQYDRDGKLVASYLYKNPMLIAPGIYFPTRVEVYSPEKKLAGVTLYHDIQVNAPVDPAIYHS